MHVPVYVNLPDNYDSLNSLINDICLFGLYSTNYVCTMLFVTLLYVYTLDTGDIDRALPIILQTAETGDIIIERELETGVL